MDTSGHMSLCEDYVSFETAKLLKEKGFEQECHTAYFNGKLVDYTMFGFCLGGDFVYAPTLQMAMKWLREEHNKIIVPGISLDDRSTISHYIVGIWYVPKNNGGSFCYASPTPYNGYPSFEEACEAAIKYALKI